VAEEKDLQSGWAERDPRPFDRRDERFDPRTDRATLIGVSYRTGGFLADRQQIYRFAAHQTETMAQWLFGLIGGIDALDEPIIDVGSGNGTYLLPIRHRRAVGLDLSRGMLLGTREAGFAGPLVESDARALPIATACVGTALANHMLYHVPNIAAAVRELRRVVRTGGSLLVITNARDHMAEMVAIRNAAIEELAGHQFRYESASARFNLDNGAEFLSASFDSVELHHRRGKLFVPETEPVIRYLASGVGTARSLPQGVEFARVMEVAERMVIQKIAEEGQLQVTTHAGAFVCS
jgi:SAM-dependent methyltransferase